VISFYFSFEYLLFIRLP